MMYSEEQKGLVCTGYTGRTHKPIVYKVTTSTGKDGSIHQGLFCPKCYRSHDFPESLKKSLDRMNQVLEDESKLRSQPPIDPEKVGQNVADTLIPDQEGGKNEEVTGHTS